MKEITLDEMQEIFEERINGRCVTIGFTNCNANCPLTFNNIEMVLYKNGEIQFIEEDEEVHYSPIFKSENIGEIRFDDYFDPDMPDNQTGG